MKLADPVRINMARRQDGGGAKAWTSGARDFLLCDNVTRKWFTTDGWEEARLTLSMTRGEDTYPCLLDGYVSAHNLKVQNPQSYEWHSYYIYNALLRAIRKLEGWKPHRIFYLGIEGIK
jgi:hypothetical protein